MGITRHEHEILTKCFEKNPLPDKQERDLMAVTYGISHINIEFWFSKCRVMGPEVLWAEHKTFDALIVKKETMEEQEKNKEREEQAASMRKITAHQHKTLKKIYEKNPTPDFIEREIIGKTVEMTNACVDCWFFRCRTMGSQVLWAELSLEKKYEEEQKKNKEEQERTEIMTKLSQAEAKITSQAAEIQKLESWITNITTMSKVQQSDPAEKESELKKQLEAEIQSKKKLEKQVRDANKKIEELSWDLMEMNDKIETLTQKTQKQSVELEEQVENGKQEKQLNKIIAQLAAEHKVSGNILGGIKSLVSIQSTVKDTLIAQQEQLAKLVDECTYTD